MMKCTCMYTMWLCVCNRPVCVCTACLCIWSCQFVFMLPKSGHYHLKISCQCNLLLILSLTAKKELTMPGDSFRQKIWPRFINRMGAGLQRIVVRYILQLLVAYVHVIVQCITVQSIILQYNTNCSSITVCTGFCGTLVIMYLYVCMHRCSRGRCSVKLQLLCIYMYVCIQTGGR